MTRTMRQYVVMDSNCTRTPDGAHRGIGGFGYCTECGYAPCPVCTHRATAYGLGPCDAHNGDVWPTRKDN